MYSSYLSRLLIAFCVIAIVARPQLGKCEISLSEDHHPAAPYLLGFRMFAGVQSKVLHREFGQSAKRSDIHGIGMTSEWAFLHHHLEMEVVVGIFTLDDSAEGVGEVVVKTPLHLTPTTEVVLGVGGVVESEHHHVELGVTFDLGARFWVSEHWGGVAEVDYIRLQHQSDCIETILELEYRL